MLQPPTFTAWKVTGRSPGDIRALQHWLCDHIDLDRVFTDTIHTIPNGVEQVKTEKHRLGDYFANIRIVPDVPQDIASFRLIFQRRPEAGRYWKDLMVNIVQEIEAQPQQAAIVLDGKGEIEPVTPPTSIMAS